VYLSLSSARSIPPGTGSIEYPSGSVNYLKRDAPSAPRLVDWGVPIYVANGAVFLVNLKCGYSSMEELANKGTVQRVQALGASLHPYALYHHQHKPWYIVVRDPVERVKSFYVDKCLRPAEERARQACQQALYRALEADEGTPITWEAFEGALLSGGYKDPHLVPQADLLEQVRRMVRARDVTPLLLGSAAHESACPGLPHANRDHADRKAALSPSPGLLRVLRTRYARDFELVRQAQVHKTP